jgi:DNA-binding CsgD family transcriptional regulator
MGLPDTANQTTLVSAILDGAFETPPWSSFLAQLRQLTQAEFVTLLFRPPGRPLGEALHLFVGAVTEREMKENYLQPHSSLDFLIALEMEEGRVYSFAELYPPRNPALTNFFNELVVPSGITVCRMLRVAEPSGVSAWLGLSRRENDFGRQDDATLKLITPILRGALRNYVALEHANFTASVAGDAMRRLHFGWMALDAHGYIVDHDREAERVFTLSGVIGKGPKGLLTVENKQLKTDIFRAIEALAGGDQANSKTRARAFTLSRDPWLDMLLMAASSNRLSANPRAAVIAYIHADSWQATDRCEQLSQLFNLSRSEAKLAFALSRGMTITRAAESLGIKIGTARKCSKMIYAKTGAGGLPDLVRIVMRSVLALAPKE